MQMRDVTSTNQELIAMGSSVVIGANNIQLINVQPPKLRRKAHASSGKYQFIQNVHEIDIM